MDKRISILFESTAGFRNWRKKEEKKKMLGGLGKPGSLSGKVGGKDVNLTKKKKQ